MFRVTADALRVAQGAVRCGVCSSRFNALESLRDDADPRYAEPAPEDTITVEEMPGNELIELSTPSEAEAAAAAESGATPDEVFGPAGVAGLAPAAGPPPEYPLAGEWELPPEASAEALEFHGTAEDLEKVFVLDRRPAARIPADDAAGPAPAAGSLDDAIGRMAEIDHSGIEVREEPLFPAEERELADLDRTDEFPILLLDDEPRDGEDEAAGGIDTDHGEPVVPAAAAIDGRRDVTPAPHGVPRVPPRATPGLGAAAAEAARPEPPPRFLIPPELRRDLETPAPERAFTDLGADADEPAPRRWPWISAALLLLLALGAQAVHHWRDELARNPQAGPWVLRLYDSLGLPIEPPSDLAAFELRQWGATSDAAQPGQLRLRASIVNRAAFAQPYPLLRLSLQDRFGNTISARDVEPSDYLPGGAGGRLLPSQARVDAEIAFVDPGREAVGYELDLCLRSGEGLRCASTLARAP